MSLFTNIRFYVLVFSFLLSGFLYFYVNSTIEEGSLQTILLLQYFALTAVTYLYLALLAGPVCYTFRFLPFRARYLQARRAIGVSAFYFAVLHAYLAFFKSLGGFAGLGFLTGKYLLAIGLSFTALIILSLMAATSFDVMVEKLTFPRWKALHRLVYIAGIFILIHALMLGSHFQDLSEFIPKVFAVGLIFLLILESIRIDHFLQSRFMLLPRVGLGVLVTLMLVSIYLFVLFNPAGGALPLLGIHSQHIQLAKEAQKITPANIENKRFTVDIDAPSGVISGRETALGFKIFEASSGNPISFFDLLSDKKMHLIIVNSSLDYYHHIHPEQTGSSFSVATSFPNDGVYHLYLDFKPLGSIEQQFGFTLNVGNSLKPALSTHQVDTNLTKNFGDYTVTLNHPPLNASQLSLGQQTLTFSVSDLKGTPITSLKPYLGSFGHLVMINKDTYDYLHVHPVIMTPPKPGDNGGPQVKFLPIGLYGPIKPGVYRVFAQLNPDNNLFTADFTVKVE